MPSRLSALRRLYLLLGTAWLFAFLYATVYAWLTASSYARIVFKPQFTESATALRECGKVPQCASDAATYVHTQESILDAMMLVVRGTAWLMAIAQVALLVAITVATWRRHTRAARPAFVRFADIAWKVQAVAIGTLLLLYAAILIRGQALLADIPEPVRIVTFEAAFSSPFFDFGTMYYLMWFLVMNTVAVLSIRLLASAIRTV